MIICPNCNHQNPEGSVQCESCYTPLPVTAPCPNCGARVQTNATFCGQCGYNLQGSEIKIASKREDPFEIDPFGDNSHQDSWEKELIPTTMGVESFQSPWDIDDDDDFSELEEDEPSLSFDDTQIAQSSMSVFETEDETLEELTDDPEEAEDIESWLSSLKEESSSDDEEDLDLAFPEMSESADLGVPVTEFEIRDLSESADLGVPVAEQEDLSVPVTESNLPEFLEEPSVKNTAVSFPESVSSGQFNQEPEQETINQTVNIEPKAIETPTVTNAFPTQSSMNADTSTRLQLQRAILFHLQTGSNLEIPLNLAVIHIGKPNNQVPPDIDVSGFPNSEIVSRIHADIRVEGDTYFIEDQGSSNGTYVNHSPLLTGNRHRLRAGDRISLGKGDLMTFIFQLN